MKNNNWGICPIPAGAFGSLSKEIDALFDSFFREPLTVFKNPGFPYAIREEKQDNKVVAHVIEVALAGVSRDRVKVSVKEDKYSDYLNISVDKAESKENVVYTKLSNSSYRLDLALYDNHDVNGISSELKDGLLTVKIPVVQAALVEPSVKQIEIG